MAVSEYDKQYLSSEQQAQMLDLTNQWNALDSQHVALRNEEAALRAEGKTAEADAKRATINQIKTDKAALHDQAEAIRATKDYLGGQDGSQYIPIEREQDAVTTPTVQNVTARQPSWSSEEMRDQMLGNVPTTDPWAVTKEQKDNLPDADKTKAEMQALLDAQKATMDEQTGKQIDYAVDQGVTALERAEEDAQAQFKEQQESITRDEMQSRDNAALYAEARGDKGGIGEEQYSSIMNTAAQNRLNVQQAQTKLSTDTQRQIADLRAQGEFEKADALLEISQNYLARLMTLEQWAFDAGLSVEQFKASLDQWAANYEMAIAEFTTGIQQWAANYDLDVNKYLTDVDMFNAEMLYNASQAGIANKLNQDKFDYTVKQDELDRLTNSANTLLNAGVANLSDAQLSAIGLTAEQASAVVSAVKQANDKSTLASAAEILINAGVYDISEEQLKAIGLTAEQAKTLVDAVNEEKQAALDAAQNELDLEWAKLNAKGDSTEATNALYQLVDNNVPAEVAEGWLVGAGWDPEEARVIAKAYQKLQDEAEEPEADTETESSAATPTSTYGPSYSTAWSQARKMFDSGKSEAEILAYLDTFTEDRLSNEGLAYIMSSLNLGGYRTGVK